MTAARSDPSRARPEARVAAGRVRGGVEDGVAVFRGIPFAAPPVGVATPSPIVYALIAVAILVVLVTITVAVVLHRASRRAPVAPVRTDVDAIAGE